MSFINYAAREINCKILYCGPSWSGKTSNIQKIYESTHDTSKNSQKGLWFKLTSENEKTLFFDFLPLSIGEVRGFKTRFHLYSLPGENFYESSRQFILKGVDGIVFVTDSQNERMEANIESLESLQKSLEDHGYELSKLPFVFQYNKRDLSDALSMEELEASLNPTARVSQAAVASQGKGVLETLQFVSQLILKDLKGG